jgi:transposase
MVSQDKFDELNLMYEQLVAERDEYKSYKDKLEGRLEQSDKRIQELMQQLMLMQRRMFAGRSERQHGPVNDLQSTLFELEALPKEAKAETELVTIERRKKTENTSHAGRNPFPENLPAEEKTILHPLADPETMIHIGTDVSERLSMKPAQLFVKRYIYPKYKDPATGLIYQSTVFDSAFSRFKVDETVAAHVVVQKTIDHLPLYRQARIFERQKVTLAESTLGDLYAYVAKLLLPLYEAHRKDVLSGGYLNVDETTIQVLDSDKKGASHRGYYWVCYNNPAKTVLFVYDPSRARGAPQKILIDFQGYLQTDGYGAYEKFDEVAGITLVGCLAHARRKFFEAMVSDKALADEALALFGQVYAVEKHIRETGLVGEEKLAWRQAHAVPALEALHTWMKEKYAELRRPTSRMRMAIEYSLKRWDKLALYAGTDLLDPDNNRVENAIRPVAVGRKNFLFAGSHDAAQRSAMFYSLLGTCKAHGIEPFTWLSDVLQKLPTHPINRIKDLLPQYYKG